MSVDGDDSVRIRPLFAGLPDTDIHNFCKITIRLQVLLRKYSQVIKTPEEMKKIASLKVKKITCKTNNTKSYLYTVLRIIKRSNLKIGFVNQTVAFHRKRKNKQSLIIIIHFIYGRLTKHSRTPNKQIRLIKQFKSSN